MSASANATPAHATKLDAYIQQLNLRTWGSNRDLRRPAPPSESINVSEIVANYKVPQEEVFAELKKRFNATLHKYAPDFEGMLHVAGFVENGTEVHAKIDYYTYN